MKDCQTIIEINNLVKKFGSLVALDGLDIKVAKGEVHGFLGPNGSGKSTTIRVLLGLLRKTSGDVKIFGEDPWTNAVSLHKRLAYIPGDVSFWPGLSGGEIIDLIGNLRGGLDESRRRELLRVFDLDPRKKFSTYSKGNRQKVALVAALASDVDLYIFDEPTSGLDPLMESVFQDEVRKLKNKNKTVFLSSHILAEAESLCDRVSIIRKGKIVEAGDLNAIRSKHRIFMTVVSEEELSDLSNIEGVYEMKREKMSYHFEAEESSIDSILKYLSAHEVQSVFSQPPSLEHLFLSHYNEED